MEFKITYEIKGQRRKELVEAISDYLIVEYNTG